MPFRPSMNRLLMGERLRAEREERDRTRRLKQRIREAVQESRAQRDLYGSRLR